VKVFYVRANNALRYVRELFTLGFLGKANAGCRNGLGEPHSPFFFGCLFIWAEIKRAAVRRGPESHGGKTLCMENIKAGTRTLSREKYDPGFVKLRRGLRDHLGSMSGNAVKLFDWLLLAADWKGPSRGWVEASFADVAKELRFSSKTLQRACDELEDEKQFVAIERATNQYGLTRFKILKYDATADSSGVDRFDHSNSSAVDSGVDISDHSNVHSDRPNPLESKHLQLLKNLEEVKKETSDAVRRRFDAELHPCDDDLVSKTKPKTSFEAKSKTSSPGKAKLRSRIEAIIRKNKESYAEWIDREQEAGRPHPFTDAYGKAFNEIGYDVDLRAADVTWDFVYSVRSIGEQNQGKAVSPGNLCSKIMDDLDRQRVSDQENGGDGGGYYWPHDFQEHRDALRERERVVEAATQAKVAKPSKLCFDEAQELVDRKEATWVDDRKQSIKLTPGGVDRRSQTSPGVAACAR
jgi:hypothetical protein